MTDNSSPASPAPKTVQNQKKEKKPGVFKRMEKYLRETRSEVKKVIWPNRQQILNNTLVTVICIVVVSVFIGILDLGFTKGLQWLLGLLISLRG